MILLEKKVHGISMFTVWYADKPIQKDGIILYREAMFDGGRKTVHFDTLINDLTETEEEIKQHFSKSCKYKINRAQRENVSYTIKESKDITNEDIEEYCSFYQEFWKSKEIEFHAVKELKEELESLIEKNALTLSIASINEHKTIYHTHVIDEQHARLLHSVSLYRVQDEEEQENHKNIVGIANRYLHYEEMKYFKQIGKSIYDWGGAGTADDVISITEFKQSFGGTPAVYYDFVTINGMKPKLVNLASTIKNRIRH